MKYDGVSRLEIFYFLMYYVYMSGLLSEVLCQEGNPQSQFLQIKIKIWQHFRSLPEKVSVKFKFPGKQ